MSAPKKGEDDVLSVLRESFGSKRFDGSIVIRIDQPPSLLFDFHARAMPGVGRDR